MFGCMEREVEASLTAWRGRLRNSLPFRKNKNKIEISSGHRVDIGETGGSYVCKT